ncbi:MAG: cation diffusion facilitator family transporter [Pseudonocardia sp.]|nr:cation diffusion facilitator family transporter [Pseudonocardia sp.]
MGTAWCEAPIRGTPESVAKSGGESTLTVLLAMGANLAVGVAKLVAGLLTGSAAMLSEAAHSVGDTMTEVLLLTALKRSAKPPDRTHPFGYGKERYVFSLLAAVSIFVAGALFPIYQGVHTLLGGAEQHQDVLVALIVLVVAAAIEGVSLTQAIRQVSAERREEGLDLLTFVRRSDDPTVITVLYEDSAAITGLVIAFAGVGLTALTGSRVWDGVASLLIGLLLVAVAYGLTRTNMALLIGRQADPRMVRAIGRRLGEQPEVDEVIDLLTMLTGTDKVLVCARLDFAQSASSDDIEQACVRIDNTLREEFSDVDEVFLEPVPRGDQDLRARVRARYGADLRELAPAGSAEPESHGPALHATDP